MLAKPVSVSELRQCVDDAQQPSSDVEFISTQIKETPTVEAALSSNDDARAISRYFAGDPGLYAAFRTSCLAQFRFDVRQGDRATALADTAALMHLGHSLKTVLDTLGHDAAGNLAMKLGPVNTNCT